MAWSNGKVLDIIHKILNVVDSMLVTDLVASDILQVALSSTAKSAVAKTLSCDPLYP
jgi:hypothetical protein